MSASPQLILYYGISWRDFATRAAALTVLLYDHMLTFEDEVELFWKKPWTIATYLFIWVLWNSRAISWFHPHHVWARKYCRYDWNLLQSWLGSFSLWAVELMLQLRLYALYNCSRRVAIIVGSVFLVYLSAFIGILSFASWNHFGQPEAYFLAGYTYCEPMHPRLGNSYAFWIIVASFEAFVLGLTMHKGYQNRHRGTVPVLADIYPTLTRDSVLYLICTGSAYLSNVFLYFVNLDDNMNTLSGFAYVMPIVMGSRITINIRKVCDKHSSSPASPSQVSLDVLPGLNDPGQYV